MHVDGPHQVKFDGQIGGSFAWNDYGLALTFPPNCVQQNVDISVSALLPLKNEIHPGIYIVSDVFKFYCNVKKFNNAFTLRLRHCVNLQSPEDCHKICFIIQHGDTTESDMKCGYFEVGNPCGTIKLKSFSLVFIAWMVRMWRRIRIRTRVRPSSETHDDEDDSLHSQERNNLFNSENSQHYSNQQSSSSLSPNAIETTSCSDSLQMVNIQLGGNCLSSSKNSHCPSDQQNTSLSPSSVDASSCEKVKEQEKDKKDASPFQKYEEMLAVPKNHSELPEWKGIYSVYLQMGGWKIVCYNT